MIYIGVPTYDAKIHHTTVGGLFNVAFLMGRHGHGVILDVIPNDCFISHARNLMATRFLQIEGATDMVMIDADVGFGDEDFDLLIKANGDIVCGVYRYKEDTERYPCVSDPENVKRGRLKKLVYGPAGFMKIRRKVLEKMAKTTPKFEDDGGSLYDFFPSGVSGTGFKGEDANFCMNARNAGFDVWGLTGLKLKHTGAKTYVGAWEG